MPLISPLFKIFSREMVDALVRIRTGETKLGEKVAVSANANWQEAIKTSDAQFVLIGIPEDVGVRANYGIGGAHTAWEAALKALLNIQSIPGFIGDELLVLGAFDFSGLMEQSEGKHTVALREMVTEIDDAVYSVIQEVVVAGKIPIAVGGGHNNAYPLLKGSSLALNRVVNATNLDAHSDYRALEGRHSGNGFRYAKADGFLGKYAAIGLHENYNAANIISEFQENPDLHASFYDDAFVRTRISFDDLLKAAFQHTQNVPTGIELDLDCIENVLSSATSPSGISVQQARRYVYRAGKETDALYLHLPEGATLLDDGRADGSTGKLIAYLISDFIKGVLEP